MRSFTKIKKRVYAHFGKKTLLFAPWAAEDRFYAIYQQWYGPFKKIFGKVTIFDPKKNLAIYGRDLMNEKFLLKVEKEKPDFIYLWMINDEFYLETIIKIKEISPKTKIMNHFGDDDERFDHYTKYYAKYIDYSLIYAQLPQEHYKKQGLKNVFLLIGPNTDHFKPLNLEKKYDVSFMGIPKKDRGDQIKFLMDNGINIKIFGPGWYKYPELSEIYGGVLDDEEIVKINNETKINLAFTKNYQKGPHMKGRSFEIQATNSFALIENSPRYRKFFKKDEIVMFEGKEDLLKKVKYYLKNSKEREQIAKKAYKRIITEYDMNLEFLDFFNKVLDNKFSNEPIKEDMKTYTLSKKDLFLNAKDLNSKLKTYDYITFSNGKHKKSKNKNKLQVYAIKSTKKEISCCDYSIYSDSLGDYLSFQAANVMRYTNPKNFSKFLNINQLLVTKNYFLENKNLFLRLFNKDKVNFLTEDNTSFVSIPLLKIRDFPKNIESELMGNVFNMKFIEKLSSLTYQKKLFLSLYLYRLFLESLNGKKFILKYIYDNNVKNKNYLKKLLKIFTKKTDFYN